MNLLLFFSGGWNFGEKIHIFLFLHSRSIQFMIRGKIQSEYFLPQLPQVVLRLFCNLLHFPGFPSAPPRAVFACPVEAWPSLHLHLNRQSLERPKRKIYISMSRLHKLNSSLGNPAQKVTANTSQGLLLTSLSLAFPSSSSLMSVLGLVRFPVLASYKHVRCHVGESDYVRTDYSARYDTLSDVVEI